MSFDGYDEYIGKCGHYWTRYTLIEPNICPICKANPEYVNFVEDAIYGGRDVASPIADKKEIGFTEEIKNDGNGNTYTMKHPRYVPTSKEWKELNVSD